MSRLSDLIVTEELTSTEREELRKLFVRLEESAYSADGFISGSQTTFEKRIRVLKELEIGGRWLIQAYVSGITQLKNLLFINQTTGNTVLRLGNLGNKVEVRTNLNFAVPAAITIASGVIAVTHTYTKVDTEGAAATDDLDTINEAVGASITGQLLILRAFDTTHTVVAKDGTGNLRLAGDMTLDSSHDTLVLLGDQSFWYELSRSNNE